MATNQLSTKVKYMTLFLIIVNGGFTDFNKWSTCSKTCGGGTQTRSRTCTDLKPAYGGKGCSGLSQQIQPCNVHDCPGSNCLLLLLLLLLIYLTPVVICSNARVAC